MKVMTVLGTRPEIIRLSRIIERLDALCDHTLVHTGQNYAPELSDLFFDELHVRRPDHVLNIRAASFGQQIGMILTAGEAILREKRPDRLLVLGDTNSALIAIAAKRLGIPVYHMEAGNRCYDDRVPEEVNRRIIDHCSDVLMPYTERSRANLLREGIEAQRTYVTGNPINEIVRQHEDAITASDALRRLGIEPNRYMLATMHREENVDVEPRLRSLAVALGRLAREYDLPVICSVHPRTADRLKRYHVELGSDRVRCLVPFGFIDFIALERSALCVLSDSGTVQEECCIQRVATVTIRDVTERPETVECGSNILAGTDPDQICLCVQAALKGGRDWKVPAEYLVENVSDTAVRILLSYGPVTPPPPEVSMVTPARAAS
jgi:UDP-N-acetylglucosamine 2-epimerase (non-hydrolysing)